jgi:Fungal specific transcription factor domain/Fungal Zn(2)-Cys(6) binuclear cluster domain
MASATATTKARVRTRAPRACTQCSQRKVLCDGAEGGIPCSRCRVDRRTECIFLPSRRGTYPRQKKHVSKANNNTHLESTQQREPVRNRSAVPRADSSRQVVVTRHTWTYPETNNNSTACEDANTRLAGFPDNSSTTSSPSAWWPANAAVARDPPSSPARPGASLAAMFEDFLDSQGTGSETVVGKRGIIILADSSPLTFALEELRRDKTLHDVGSRIPNRIPENEEGLAGPQGIPHPAHMSPADISYLNAKGAFEFPQGELLSSLVSAFLDKFYPLYSIVNRVQFEQLYEQQKLPWILMHAVCFIGATYCEHGVIHRSSLKSRWHARRHFYDKAKVLFDLGYETDKIILLQTIILLTFWGPQMKSYWNPCSWIGFGVTVADSLGIYKSNSSAQLPPADRSLLRRLWWTLAVRDAYCAALLGRPFRINMARSDTEALGLDDFNQHGDSSQTVPTGNSYTGALYQIQVAKLSLILRQIVLSRSKGTYDSQMTANVHALLNQWQADLPAEVDWRKPSNSINLCATSLKIIFHHQLIVIHFGEPHSEPHSMSLPVEAHSPSIKIAEQAAQTIAASALTIMTSSMVGNLPHEVFPGFFITGIMFYRQMKNHNGLLVQLGQAALDNCRMVIHEARERWDAAQWVLGIFDFLLSRSDRTEQQQQQQQQGERPWPQSSTPAQDHGLSRDMTDPDATAARIDVLGMGSYDLMPAIDLHPLPNQHLMSTVNEIMLTTDYFKTVTDCDFNNIQF